MDKKTPLRAKENGMNRLYSMMFLIAGAVAMPAMADGHGDHRKGAERMKNVVKQMDANNDGAISFDEFRMPEGRDAPEMRMDANGDGEITRDEASQIATQRTEEALDRSIQRDSVLHIAREKCDVGRDADTPGWASAKHWSTVARTLKVVKKKKKVMVL